MMKYFLTFLIILFSHAVYAQDEPSIALENAPINSHDKKSIERGAKFFATVCMACHTLIYMRYDPIAQQAGITYEKMPTKITNWPNGVKPPDLTLEASRRGVDWIYTYLHSFYVDPSRPTGFNNLLVPKTAMPDMVQAFQGRQILTPKLQVGDKIYDRVYQWYDLVELQSQGSMSPDKFDDTIVDLVNFLNYASSPYQIEQHQIGIWVIGYLFIFFILMYWLKKSYWKNIKRLHE